VMDFFFFFFFWGRISWTICPGWLQTAILLISVSWVARITGVSHWHPVELHILKIAFTAILITWITGVHCRKVWRV
jgi:hypothetical protein